MDDNTKNLIQNHIDSNEVCLFMKGTPDAPQCGFSNQVVQILNVLKLGGTMRRYPAAGVGDMAKVSVKKGTPDTRRQMFNAIIIRQRRPFRRVDGTWVQFEDNACVIVNEKGDVQGSDIKGPVSREAAERWPRIAANAKQIV